MQWWQHVLRIIILSVIYHKHLLPLSLLPPWAMKTAEWSLILQNASSKHLGNPSSSWSRWGYIIQWLWERELSTNKSHLSFKTSYSCHMWPIIQRKKYFIIETVSYLFVSQLMECLSLQQLCGELKNICYGANPATLNFKFFDQPSTTAFRLLNWGQTWSHTILVSQTGALLFPSFSVGSF